MKIKAAVVEEKNGPFIFEEIDLASPNENEILVKVIASGICHTDEFGRTELPDVLFPMVLGHEGAGIVEQIGKNVKDIAVGDHVAFSYAYCAHCNPCYSGEPYYCDHFNEINMGGVSSDGTTRLSKNGKPVSMFFGQSSFATHAVINQNSAVKVDKEIDLSLIAPLGCGIQTGAGAVINAIQPRISDSIAVFGCGAVGMSAIMAANAMNCKTVIAVGGNEKSLQLARELGATDTINRKEIEDIPSAIQAVVSGGVNYAIDTSGYGPFMLKALRSTKFHGELIALAPTGTIENFDIGTDVLGNMRTVKGICEGDSIPHIFIPEIIELYKKGLFPLDKLISVYAFDEIEQAFQDSHTGKVIKPVLKINQ